jgi:cytochrome bd-type quinol oxidase subunit 1
MAWSKRAGVLAAAGAFLVLVAVAMHADGSDAERKSSFAAVEAAVTAVHSDAPTSRVAISEQKRAEMKKHAVSGASLVSTKMEGDEAIPSSPLENILGSSTESVVGEVNKTTGEQVTGIDPKTGKRIDTGEMPSFIFPILLALGGTVIMIAVFTYMCCFKTEVKEESKRAPSPKK